MDLVRAAATGNVKELQAALIAGKDVEYKDEDGWTALMKAAKVGNVEGVHLLLARGVDVNFQSKRGQSALAIAAEQGHVGVMKLLLDAGAAAELADDIGEVPLMVAAKRSQTESMRLLLERGVDINRQAANGDTALLLAAAWCKPEAVSLLLENKADTTLAKPDNHTALMFAARFGDIDSLRLLLGSGADVHAQNTNGQTSLLLACTFGKTEIASALIDCGASVTDPDYSSFTPVMAAALWGDLSVVKLLLGNCDSVNSQARDGATALLLATWKGYTDIVKFLLDHGANTELSMDDGQTPLMWAAQGGFTAIVRLLLAKNANANATNYEGDTALKMAQNNNHSEIVALLSDRTAGPRVHHGFDAVRVASPASNQELHQNRQEPVIAPQSPDDVTMQFTDLLTMCGQMEEACTMCENVLERLQRMQIQANEQPEIVPPNAQADLASIRARFHHFLVKYKQRNPFERLVSTRMVISLLKEFHERLDAVVAEVSEGDNNLSKWMESWDRDTQEVEASLVRLWKTNPMRILDSLPSQKSQEDALVLLGSETTRKRDSYTADSKTMLRSVKQSIIRLSGASVQAVPDWFLAEYEVQREEQHFALGSFGKVYHGTWYREKVVVKCVNAVTEDEMRAFKREARLWFRAQHPNVVRLFGACHVSQPCFFVCEEAKNGNLVDFLNKSKHVDQALTWRLLHGAALGLQFLHGKKIVHGDLKCNQILVTEEKTAKLTDFGFSFALMESKPNTSTGAVRWKAPELLRSESSAPTFESDLYSFGMCVVEAVSRNVPWGSHLPDQSVIYNLNHRIFISRPKAFVSDEQWEVVCELCAFDPSKRLGLCDAIVQLSRFAEEELESHAETTV